MKKLLLAVFAMFLLIGCGDSGPEKVAEDYNKHLFNGEIAKAVELLDAKGLENQGVSKSQATEKLSYMTASVKAQVEQKGGIKSIKAVETSYNDDKTAATVRVEVTFKDGTKKYESVSLVKVDGKWKIKA